MTSDRRKNDDDEESASVAYVKQAPASLWSGLAQSAILLVPKREPLLCLTFLRPFAPAVPPNTSFQIFDTSPSLAVVAKYRAVATPIERFTHRTRSGSRFGQRWRIIVIVVKNRKRHAYLGTSVPSRTRRIARRTSTLLLLFNRADRKGSPTMGNRPERARDWSCLDLRVEPAYPLGLALVKQISSFAYIRSMYNYTELNIIIESIGPGNCLINCDIAHLKIVVIATIINIHQAMWNVEIKRRVDSDRRRQEEESFDSRIKRRCSKFLSRSLRPRNVSVLQRLCEP